MSHSREDGQIAGGYRASGRVSCAVDLGARGNAGQTETVIEGQERFPVYEFVYKPGTTSDDSAALAVSIPGKAEARSEVFVVGVINAADLLPRLHYPHVGIKVSQQIMGLGDHRTEFVAQP